MAEVIKKQSKFHLIYYVIFLILTLFFLFYYLSVTLFHPVSDRQFSISSFQRFPLTFLIFPAEIFSFLFSFYFVYTLLTDKRENENPPSIKNKEPVAILLPVYNEPKEIVERTIKASMSIKWPQKNIYLLDDSHDKEDKKNMDFLADKYKINIIRRKNRVGYKAGNINNAIKNNVKEKYFAIFDADQAPLPEFLEETIPYFKDYKTGFVQVPQYFVNQDTTVERAARAGSSIFYNSQAISKSNDSAIPFCGTNVVLNTEIFRKVNGFSYFSATEDIELGIRINEAGYRGHYVPKILVEGYAPTNFKSYCSQQYRWSNGNLAILREYWLKILIGNFPFKYKIHLLFTLGWWLIGIITLIYVLVPMISLLFRTGTHHTWLSTVLLTFLFFYVIIGISMIYFSLSGREKKKIRFSDALLEYSLIINSMFIYVKAAINSVLFKRYVGFIRTDKKKSKSGIGIIKYNLAFSALCFAFSIYGLYRTMISPYFEELRFYLPASLWLLFYSIIFASSILFVGNAEIKNGKK